MQKAKQFFAKLLAGIKMAIGVFISPAVIIATKVKTKRSIKAADIAHLVWRVAVWAGLITTIATGGSVGFVLGLAVVIDLAFMYFMFNLFSFFEKVTAVGISAVAESMATSKTPAATAA